ncbi:NAD-dependent succinate-semialdehyde dehydrogenase [Bradyrhizobium sp. CCBAU 53338]|uniref:NAD-dependent succinate-semialdehyde dehydrogenase n=1 Tax=Bradyrhizobium sp. CCBAU 53338 TaxID=1325111 RepID=UPI00188AB27E|nr:NAD-dependent succinate-semialdehyde dehydrogenase [Bradyrhizobium sp. CCBAU 53338]QOZ51452.1 succinate-semialdehyde dehydrogenase (NADP(+)) [Bradyrhizobium sp. CCBAU 53338]
MTSISLRDPALLSERCFVGGKWCGEAADPIMNPATGAVVARVPRFGAAETDAAILSAEQAFPAWSRSTAKTRSAVLKRWFELINAARDDLALLMTLEQGKPLAEARGEIDYAASFVEFFAEEAKRVYGETIPSPRANSRIMVVRQPVGVVAAITPWNFPAAMITRKVAPALAAGCTAVVKPAPETPLSALALAMLAERAGLPAGVLNVLTGDAVEIGGVLTSHPAVRLVSFTGSTEVGKLLMRQCASTVKKVALELGGNSPFIVFDDADIDAAVEGAMVSKFRNMGQTCVCANRIYVQAGIHDAFLSRLAERVGQMKVGNGLDSDVVQGPLITMDAVRKVEDHVSDAVRSGARVVTGGRRHGLGGTFYEPTVLAGVKAGMKMTQEETFGPVAGVIRFEAEAEIIAAANDTASGLAAYLYTRDVGRIFRVSEALEYGMVGINTGAISNEVAPFGGVKQSGLGREGSRHGIEEYTELKYLMLDGLAAS